MLVSFRVHLVAGFIVAISLIFNCIAIFTCHWIDISYLSYSLGVGLDSTTCEAYFKPAWNWACLSCLSIALFFQCLMILHVLTSFCVRQFNAHVLRVDSCLIGLSSFFLGAGTLTYVIGALVDFGSAGYDFGYSFGMACIATGISGIAAAPVAHALRRIRNCGDCECEGYYY